MYEVKSVLRAGTWNNRFESIIRQNE